MSLLVEVRKTSTALALGASKRGKNKSPDCWAKGGEMREPAIEILLSSSINDG